MRVCRHCEQALPPEAFQVDRRVQSDGRAAICKPCRKAYMEGRHTSGKCRPKDPIKERARWRVKDAVRYGRLAKPTRCQACQKEVPRHLLDGHHHDYSRPLEVMWLCRVCHGAEALTWRPPIAA